MILNAQPHITIKGIRDGILIVLYGPAFEPIYEALQDELAQKADFLRGSQIVLDVGKRPLNTHQLKQLQNLLEQYELTLWTVLADEENTKSVARQLGFATRLAGSQTDLEGNPLSPEPENSPQPDVPPLPETLFLRETLRSGRSIYHEGHVIVLGDVNPGAEIVATGNVMVWGRLRGLVHAGATGDETAVICALQLSPTQLRIASQIAIPPQEKQRTIIPEQASIQDGQIVATAWRP